MERVITNKSNYFASNGHEVYIITAEQMGRKNYYKLDDRITVYDMGINYSNELSILGKIFNVIPKRIKHFRRLRALLYTIKADIVVSTFGNEIFFLYKIKDGSKKIAEVHFCKDYRMKRGRVGLWKLIDYIRTKQEERLVKKYDSFITLTHEDIKNWGDTGNIHTIPNALPEIPDEVSTLQVKKLLVVGRLNYQKGIDRLLDIWKDVSCAYPEWNLHIYGSGEMYNQLKKQIRQYNLEETTYIHHPMSNISKAYLESSCYLMTSRYEGLPMVLLEAMSYGLPVISYACPCGPKDLITDGVNGYLVDDGDSEIFKEKLIEIINNESRRKELGKQARLSILNYREIVIMQKWENLFKEMLR